MESLASCCLFLPVGVTPTVSLLSSKHWHWLRKNTCLELKLMLCFLPSFCDVFYFLIFSPFHCRFSSLFPSFILSFVLCLVHFLLRLSLSSFYFFLFFSPSFFIYFSALYLFINLFAFYSPLFLLVATLSFLLYVCVFCFLFIVTVSYCVVGLRRCKWKLQLVSCNVPRVLLKQAGLSWISSKRTFTTKPLSFGGGA